MVIALAREQKDIKSRARPDEIQQPYQLKCETPEPGSYVQPAFVQPQFDAIDPVIGVA